MITIETNTSLGCVDAHAQEISQVGSLTGKKVYKIDVRLAWQGGKEGFEKDKLAIAQGTSKDFILNRSPRRLLIRDILVAGVVITKNIDDEVGIAINPKDNGECDIFLPINENMLSPMERNDVEVIREAINGEKDHFFLSGESLCKVINEAMKAEAARLEKHITACQKMLTTLKGDIANNEQKAKSDIERWIKSAVEPKPNIEGGHAVMTRVAVTED